MNWIGFIRRYLFWLLDTLKGNKIKNHIKDIQYILEHPNEKDVLKKVSLYKQNLLNHAVKTTDYYKKILPTDISNFPVVSKEMIRSNYQQFESSLYKTKKSFAVHTSGSTGASFTVYQDLNKKNRGTADIIYFSKLAGYRIGYRLYYLRFWSMFKSNNKWQYILQNVVPVDVFDLNEKSIKQLLNDLKKDRTNKGMLGYASSFRKICNYLDTVEESYLSTKVQSAIGMSERLDPVVKEKMLQYFGVQMVSRYSNTENGLLAQQPLGKNSFVVNIASYFIEILDIEEDSVLENGNIGRIVVTDLFNYHTPIIRYDTGDLGILEFEQIEGENRQVLNRVEGRKNDMIKNTSGELLSTSILLVVNKYKQIKQRQIIQKTETHYHFNLKIADKIFEAEKDFRKEFKEYFGQDARITISYVDVIPLLASGKQQAIVNEVKSKV